MPIKKINGVNLHYHTTGQGTPIIFVHPPLLTSSVFNYQKAVLSASCQVITFDIRGHGRSEASEAPLTYALIAEDMKQLLDHLDIEQAYICGYSAGGALALEAMLNYPDRWQGGILLSAMSEVSDWWLQLRLTAATALMDLGLSHLLMKGISWGNQDSPETYEQLLETAKHGDSRSIREYYAFSRTYSCTKQLPRIKQPVLLVYGQKDRSFYRYAEILHHRLPSSSLYFIRDVGHQLPTKAGDRVNSLILHWLQLQAESRAEEGGSRTPDFLKDMEVPAVFGNEWNEQELVHSERDL